MPYHLIRDIRYHFAEEGSGPPLFLLHGFTGSHQNWTTIADHLGYQSQVIIPDLLGHGRTDAPAMPDRYHMDQAARDLIALADSLNIEQFDLLGYSMGGRLALYLAVHYSHRIHSLILESTSPGLSTIEEQQARRERDDQLAIRIEQEGIESFVNFWESLSLWESQKRLPADSIERLRAGRLGNNPAGLANALRGMGTGVQPSLWDQLGGINLRVLLISGALDQKFCQINTRMVQALPNGLHTTLSGVGHTVHLEDPQRYVDLVEWFLAE